MRTLLRRTPPVVPYAEPVGAGPGRTERKIVISKYGKLYTITLRDKIVPEDPLLMMIKAEAYAIQNNESNGTKPPDRTVRDFLIKSSVGVI